MTPGVNSWMMVGRQAHSAGTLPPTIQRLISNQLQVLNQSPVVFLTLTGIKMVDFAAAHRFDVVI